MSTFSATVEKAMVSLHPNADKLEVVQVNEYQCIVAKGEFKSGDIVAYIPEQAIVPKNILEELGLVGRLSGKDKNRVRPTKIRGVLSQGLVYPSREHWKIGDDVTEELGIEKWEPPVPPKLAGEVFSAGGNRTIRYDIENFKKYPNVLEYGEPVVITEKVHGTFVCMGVMPQVYTHPQYGRLVVASKGLGGRGLAFKYDAEANKNNLYVRVARHYSIEARVASVYRNTLQPTGYVGSEEGDPVFVLGELFGQGVQDLKYGAKVDKDVDIGFRVFDIYVGVPGRGKYLNDETLDNACEALDLQRVPILYRGPYSRKILQEYTDGQETVSGNSLHIREGAVVRTQVERVDSKLGRVQLKSVSENYLCRKGKNLSEYN